jgi:O-antigen/teichoic acid export membrane protein
LSDDIKRRALSGLFWAMLQNWSSKGLSFLLFLILARLLTPTQLGVAAAINMVIALVGLIAEQGFSDAIVQRRNLKDEEINLPFYSSLAIACLMALAVVLLAERIEGWLNVPDLSPLLMVASATLPLTALSMFQEALYRRQLLFKKVAVRMLVTALIAGAVAVACAYAGMGSWSLVIQALVMNALNVLWLWYRPLWKPSRTLDTGSYKDIVGFSSSVLASRVLDVITMRSIEALIVGLHGAAALGLYAVGARVFQTLMLLLTSAVTNVSLGALSHFAHDIERLRRAFMKTLMASAAIGVPIFIGGAAVARELSIFLFGSKWAAAGDVMSILMIVGALQCVQSMNGPTFSALGRPRYHAWIALLKTVTVVASISLVPTRNVVELTAVFAIAQVVTTPLSYSLLTRCLHLRLRDIFYEVAPFFFGAACGYVVVLFVRPPLAQAGLHLVPTLFILAACFSVTYVLCVLMFGLKRIERLWTTLRR